MQTTIPATASKLCAKLAALSLLALLPCLGQNPRGTIRGKVRTRDGRIPKATVTVQFKGTGVSNAASNAHGEFRIEGLLPGNYEVRVLPDLRKSAQRCPW